MSESFKKALEFGQMGESEVSLWLQERGYTVFPAYEKELNTGKGPRVFSQKENLISPDMLIYRQDGEIHWIEAKTKKTFTWYRKEDTWQDGIDLRHWIDYKKIDEQSPWPTWLFFLHREANLTEHPEGKPSPCGLFCQTINNLKCSFNHTSDRWGTGMIYWNIGMLRKLSDYPLLKEAPKCP